MFNFSIISLTTLILIYQDVFLLNEETLILICFLIFCLSAFIKLSESIHNDLNQNSKKIKNSLKVSLNDVLQNLKMNLDEQKKLQSLPKSFEVLGNHFLKLSSAVANQLPYFLLTRSENIYTKKFIFMQRLEKQTLKLVALLIYNKLTKILILQKFYTHKLKVPNFICFQNITLLKYLMRV